MDVLNKLIYFLCPSTCILAENTNLKKFNILEDSEQFDPFQFIQCFFYITFSNIDTFKRLTCQYKINY